MKKLLFALVILISSQVQAQEEMNFKKYSLSEFFHMIENEPSDTFSLKNANLVMDTFIDRAFMLKYLDINTPESLRKDTIHIDRAIVLENVFLEDVNFAFGGKYRPAFNYLAFHNSVTLINSDTRWHYTHFLDDVNVRYDEKFLESSELNFGDQNHYGFLLFQDCTFHKEPRIITRESKAESLPIALWIESCAFYGAPNSDEILWSVAGISSMTIKDNVFLNTGYNGMYFGDETRINISGNNFNQRILHISLGEMGNKSMKFINNHLSRRMSLRIPETVQNLTMDWNQLNAGIMNFSSFLDYLLEKSIGLNVTDLNLAYTNETYINEYLDSARIVNPTYYKSEINLLGSLNSVYKRQHDLESANASYISLKDLETQRLNFLYDHNPSFDTYFQWKVNQFLKMFSDYGTKPSKAIVMSIYVILFFAMIYLFFPNSWDSHGKNRLVDRYKFFFKYLNRNAGIDEVYLEEKEAELMTYEEFKITIQQSEKKVPAFFTWSAYPLYKWAISGTRISAGILKRLDILQGNWTNLPEEKKWWKGILLTVAFVITLTYDLMIKILNALMLSINTFTTLGFGEIPIKGLPRYLAIIQGFIGWFMLTIFSVSLISQLLN